MRILFVDTGLSEAIVLRLADEGNKVFYYSVWEHADPYEGDILYGAGILDDHPKITRVQNWHPYVDKVDLIIFNDISFGEEVNDLLKRGYNVIGTTDKGEKLEADRLFPKEKFPHLLYPKLKSFSSPEKAIEYIKDSYNSRDRVVVKLSGFVRGTYVSLEREDAIDFIRRETSKAEGEDVKILVQDYIDGVEVAVGAWVSRHFPLLNFGWNMNFEHKKKFPGGLGVNTGEMGTVVFWADKYDVDKLIKETLSPMSTWLRNNYGNQYVDLNLMVEYKTGKVYVIEATCFDEETEVLTKEGWKDYKSVKVGDYVLSIDPETREISWKRITNKIVLDYQGDMIRIGGDKRAVDIFVTPDHELIYEPYHKKEIQKRRADQLPTHCKIIRSGIWKGEDIEYIIIPEYAEHHYLGKYKKYIDLSKPSVKIKATTFMRFLGIYLAEGSIGGNGHQIRISQSPKSKKRSEIKQVLQEVTNALGCKLTEGKKKDFYFSSVQLVNYLEYLGLKGKKANEKFIPFEFKNLSPRLLKELLYGFYLGDGAYHRKQFIYITSSKRLADDIQELIIKTGGVANIRLEKQKGTLMSINGSVYKRNYDVYVVSERRVKTDYYVDNRNRSTISYKGKVWDIEVEDNHTLLVRRNGKPYFSSNCRFGYPHVLITLPLIKSDLGSLFWSMASGDPTEVIYDTRLAVGIGVNISGYPVKCAMEPYYNMKFRVDYPKDKNLHKYLVPARVYKNKEDRRDEFRVVPGHGRVFVAVGVGNTLPEAQLKAIELAERVKLPDGIWRYDIGDRLYSQKSFLLEKGYLSTQRAKQFSLTLEE